MTRAEETVLSIWNLVIGKHYLGKGPMFRPTRFCEVYSACDPLPAEEQRWRGRDFRERARHDHMSAWNLLRGLVHMGLVERENKNNYYFTMKFFNAVEHFKSRGRLWKGSIYRSPGEGPNFRRRDALNKNTNTLIFPRTLTGERW